MTAPSTESQINPKVLVEQRNGVLTITLNNPATGNLIDTDMSSAIIQAIHTLDDNVKSICFRANGEDFCAGRKSPTPAKGSAAQSAEKLRHLVAEPALALYDAIKFAPVPTIAVVQGRAFGVGTALAAVCDITLAHDQARFCVPELDRDLPPALVMAALYDRVPLKTLSMLVYTREEITATDALHLGLISHVAAPHEVELTVTRWLVKLDANSLVTLRACKQYLTHAPAMPAKSASIFASHLVGTALSARY